MSMRTPAVVVGLLLLMLSVTSSRAQTAPLPMQIGALQWHLAGAVGGGAGAGSLSCTSCADGTGGGAAGFARFGGAYGSQLIVSAQLDWWSSTRRHSFQNTELTLRSTNIVVHWFPSTEQRWFVAAGFGHGTAKFRSTAPGDESASSQGVSYQLGGGYEIPLNLHLALTPYASYLATPGGRITNSQDRLSGSLLQGGVALAWR